MGQNKTFPPGEGMPTEIRQLLAKWAPTNYIFTNWEWPLDDTAGMIVWADLFERAADHHVKDLEQAVKGAFSGLSSHDKNDPAIEACFNC